MLHFFFKPIVLSAATALGIGSLWALSVPASGYEVVPDSVASNVRGGACSAHQIEYYSCPGGFYSGQTNVNCPSDYHPHNGNQCLHVGGTIRTEPNTAVYCINSDGLTCDEIPYYLVVGPSCIGS